MQLDDKITVSRFDEFSVDLDREILGNDNNEQTEIEFKIEESKENQNLRTSNLN